MSQSYLFICGCVLFSLFAQGCGGGGGSGGSGSGGTSPTCEGTTGGTYSDDSGFTLTIPDSSLSSCQNSDPAVSQSSLTSDVVETGETLLSSQASVIALNSDDDEVVMSVDNITLALPFDPTLVDPAKMDNVHVFAKVLDTDNNVLLPVFGNVGDSTLTINTYGLPANSKWVVVYDPDADTVMYTPAPRALVDNLTDQPSLLGNWAQNSWCVTFSGANATLKQTIATDLGKPLASLTIADMENYLSTNISKPARVAGSLYEDGGFREPLLQATDTLTREARDKFCSNATEPFYTIVISGSSKFVPPNHYLPANPYGTLYIGSSEVADKVTEAFGSAQDAVAHEMFHAIFAGYELIGTPFRGLTEGMATTMGTTFGKAYAAGTLKEGSSSWSSLSQAYVRSGNATETFILSNKFTTDNISASEAYSNQDLFAYWANKSYSGRLSYLSSVLEDLYTSLQAEADARKLQTIWWLEHINRLTDKMIYDSISTSLYTYLLDDLPDLYSAFITDRAYEHSATSILRSGTDSAVPGITAALFGAGTTASETVNPSQIRSSSFSRTGVFSSIPPYASRLLTLTSTETTTDDLSLPVTLADAAGLTNTIGSGASSENIRAFVRGSASAINFSAGKAVINGWGKTNKTVYILIANTTADTINLTYTLGAAEGNTAPTLSSFTCPASIRSGSSGIVSMNYADADGDITTLTETWNLSDGQTSTNSVDKSAQFSGTSGAFSSPINDNLGNSSTMTLILQYYVTDSKGNNSNTVSCTISLKP